LSAPTTAHAIPAGCASFPHVRSGGYTVLQAASDACPVIKSFNGDPHQPPATICREPRQARKGAAAAVDSGAGVKRVRVATLVRAGVAVMAYLALARRYRPRRFADVVGQAHVVRALSNALDQGRLHHAYLFAGTRGVGKTSIARIVTQCLNCERGVSSTPCGECGTCHAVWGMRHLPCHRGGAICRFHRARCRLAHRRGGHARSA